MGEAFKSHLSHVRQELEGAMERESAARVELQGLLRQEIADALRQERDQRQGLHEMLLKEQLERTQAVADVNAALQREEVERAERMHREQVTQRAERPCSNGLDYHHLLTPPNRIIVNGVSNMDLREM